MKTILEHSPTPPIEEQEPTRDGLTAVVEDLPLVRDPNLMRDARCKRCEQKNTIRQRHDLPGRDETTHDGERVRLFVGYNPDPHTGEGWQVRAVYHMDHPMLAKETAANPGVYQAMVKATLERAGWTYEDPLNDGNEHTNPDAAVVRDVEIEWFSPVDEGEDRPPQNPADENGVADPSPTDPFPNWPDEENEWRREIIEELGNEEGEPFNADKVLDPNDGLRDPETT